MPWTRQDHFPLFSSKKHTSALYIFVQNQYSKEERLMALLVSKSAGLSFPLNSGQFQMFFKVMERMLGYISHSQIPAMDSTLLIDTSDSWRFQGHE